MRIDQTRFAPNDFAGLNPGIRGVWQGQVQGSVGLATNEKDIVVATWKSRRSQDA